jgi:hypothetical protein
VEHIGGVTVSAIQSFLEGHLVVLMGWCRYLLRNILPIMYSGIINLLDKFLGRPPTLSGSIIGPSVRFVVRTCTSLG